MKLVLAPDKFKGCLTAARVCDAMAVGARSVDPTIPIDSCPMADGGEGTVDALVRAAGGRFVTRRVTGPLPGMQVDATFGLIDNDRTAVIEMAAASGLHLLRPEQYDPMGATTFGTGELLRAAAELGVSKIILGIGGSASTDGGVGCAAATGQFPIDIEILVACDVNNPLYGPNGAAHVYAPQKGASPAQVQQLDARLRKLAGETGNDELAQVPGAGAAGGMGFGMMAFFGAKLRSGVEIVIEATKLRDRLAGADLCVTGEGQFDEQSSAGKVTIGVARLCGELNVPCALVAGCIRVVEPELRKAGFSRWTALRSGTVSREEAIANAAELLARAVGTVIT